MVLAAGSAGILALSTVLLIFALGFWLSASRMRKEMTAHQFALVDLQRERLKAGKSTIGLYTSARPAEITQLVTADIQAEIQASLAANGKADTADD